jgi:hypothetical protein
MAGNGYVRGRVRAELITSVGRVICCMVGYKECRSLQSGAVLDADTDGWCFARTAVPREHSRFRARSRYVTNK